MTGLEGDQEALMELPDLEYAVLKQLERAAVTNNLAPVEYVKAVIFAPDTFSQANGQVTNTMKLKRHNIRQKYQARLEETYKKLSVVDQDLETVNQTM